MLSRQTLVNLRLKKMQNGKLAQLQGVKSETKHFALGLLLSIHLDFIE